MFRVKNAQGLINRFGWNSIGAYAFAENLRKWRSKPNRRSNPVGVNIGFNKNSPEPIPEYIGSFIKVAPYVDYAVISVSTPNSPNVRDLQKREHLTELLAQTMTARAEHAPKLPVLLKISPDIFSEALQEDIASVALTSGIQGMIVGNTSITRPDVIPPDLAKEAGGFSGPAMFAPTTQLLSNMYRLTQGKIPLIGNCAIFNGEDAYKKIRAGASLVQIYTALIYEGPYVVGKIKRELAALLKRDGFTSVTQAVGVDVKR
jgi:dihydroorotate dehydrogenase